MAFQTHKNWPYGCLEDSYAPKANEAIEEGMMVKLDSNGELVKADGSVDEYAMIAIIKQPENFFEQGEKITVIKENASVMTDQYKQGDAYVPHAKLQVSQVGGEQGIVRLHQGGATVPVIGRFVEFVSHDETTFMKIDLTRS